MCKISIIVPVYNAERTLSRCVDSMLAQTFGEYEILLIDDGSTDGSAMLCDSYAAQDRRVRVKHQPNGGVSAARQSGMEIAGGDYVIHADADDWVEPDMLRQLYDTARRNEADMVLCDYILELHRGPKTIELPTLQQSTKGLIGQLLKGEVQSMLWNKLIRRSCYDGIAFPRETNFCEDLYVLVEMLRLKRIRKIEYLSRAFYHYNKTNANSLTNKASLKMLKGQMFIADYFSQCLPNGEYRDELFLLKYFAKQLAMEVGTLGSNEFVSIYPEINKHVTVKWGPKELLPSLSLYLAARGYYHLGVFIMNLWRGLLRIIAICRR